MERFRDEQGVVTGWLVRVLLVVALIGAVLFDAGSIAWNYFGTDSTADDIALEVSESIETGTPAGLLQVEAKKLAKAAGAKLVGKIEVTADNVQVKIRRDATTLVISRIDAISDWGSTSATGSAPTS